MPYLCGGGAVYVEAFAERLYHILVAGEMRHDAEFYLAVVGREEQASRLRHKALPDFLSIIIADGDVLKVGVGA